ncbi:MAG: glutamate 5-kinase [Alphaproteobacteria bacterium]
MIGKASVAAGANARRLGRAKRIVIKIGSALLTDSDSGALRSEWLRALIDDVAALHQGGAQVVLVSSGAIALGRGILGLHAKVLRLEESQAAAAAGQVHLAHAYQAALAARQIPCAQILLTLEDTEQRRRYLNARNTFNTLLKLGAVPVVNENDTVATSEIRYGDNDRLAARVAQMISADCMVLLSDIDGLYSADPGLDPAARHFSEVTSITPEIEAMAGGSGSNVGTGGMITKLAAAKIATGAGCAMAIANGAILHPLQALLQGGRCTWFLAHGSPAAARKQWIAGVLEPAGRLLLDGGAVQALYAGKSLLPAGVREIMGEFSRGDAVIVLAPDGNEIGRGLCAYSAGDARQIAGHKSGEIERLLGYRGRTEMIHRDDLVLTGGGKQA